jgi:hypothetical protein
MFQIRINTALFWISLIGVIVANTRHMSDRASQVLAHGVSPGMPQSYRALADHGGVPHSTLHHRARGRRSREQKAESQQYLTP